MEVKAVSTDVVSQDRVSTVVPQVLPDPDGCQLFITKKKRYCKFPPTRGQKYCIQHLPKDESGEYELNGRKRIPCPLDPNHSIYEHRLESHLKKCNSKHVDPEDFHKYDVNSGLDSESSTAPEQISLSEIDLEEIKSLVQKINKLYQVHIRLEQRIEEHNILKEDLSNPEHQKCLKHRKQEASLLGNMEKSGWLTDGTDYIEFGAGRARLSSYLLESISAQSKSSMLLVDRGATRNKCENRYKFLENGPSLQRLRIDIKDLALEDHPLCKNTDNEIVAYSKHLCGSATDLTLRCIERLGSADCHTPAVEVSKKPKLLHKRVKGIQIALCCHHRCLWTPYVGKKFWRDQGLSPKDFMITRTLSSWATCAFPDKTDKKEDKPDHVTADVFDIEHSKFSFWSSDERESIGLQCKRLIDIGREKYLNRIGYKTALAEYVQKNVSLENIMLVASPVN